MAAHRSGADDRRALVRNYPAAYSRHHRAAIAFARDHNIGLYDALIIAAALEADCDTLYTDDLQLGRRFGACVVVNPFLESET